MMNEEVIRTVRHHLLQFEILSKLKNFEISAVNMDYISFVYRSVKKSRWLDELLIFFQ